MLVAPSDPRPAPRAGLRDPLSLLGLVCLAAGVLLNEWSVPWLAGRETAELQPRSVLAIRTLQGAALAAGVTLVLRTRWAPALARPPLWSEPRRAWRADRGALAALVPFLALDAMFWTLGCVRDEVPLASLLALVSLACKLAVDGLLLVTAALLVARVTRVRRAALVVAAAWGLVVASETLLLWFGWTRFELTYVEGAAAASLGAYASVGSALFLLAALALSCRTGLVLAREARHVRWSTIGRAAGCATFLAAANLPARYVDLTRAYRGPLEQADTDAHSARLAYLNRDSVLRLLGEALGSTRSLQPIDDLGPYAALIERHGFGLGRPSPAPTGGAPFRRVVVVFVESLSLDFSGATNPALPETLTPFLDSPLLQRSAFRRHRANTQPSLPGLAVTLLSHPNPDAAHAAQPPPSLPGVLAAAGWSTVLLRADSRHFCGAGVVMRRLGFTDQLDRELFLADPARAPYVSEWGACDRVLFDEALDQLEARRDEPTFLTLLTCDTHSPFGRRDYHGLEYPPAPDWIRDVPDLELLLESVFRLDHDLGRFITGLAARGLFGEDTLVVITADHSCPITVELLQLPGARPTSFGRIPFVLLSPRTLPRARRDLLTTQLDVAPSLLHLFGEDVPPSMWGRSVFDETCEPPTFLGWFRERLTVDLSAEQRILSPGSPATREDELLGELFLGVVTPRTGRSGTLLRTIPPPEAGASPR